MNEIKLEGSSGCFDTLVSNRFIDEFMPSANGEFVKIYLYLLRALSDSSISLSVSKIADIFNHTEKDILRALKYWEQAGLIVLSFNTDKSLSGITLKSGFENPVNTTDNSNKSVDISDKPDNTLVTQALEKTSDSFDNFSKKVYTANEIDKLKEREEVLEFLYLAEKYIGKQLNRTDVNSLLYIYDTLGFNPDLIEYLLEYCVSNGHKSMRYIEKIALSWAEEGINNVSLARTKTDLFINTCYPVLKAFGLNGRNPSKGEKEFIIKWTNTYGFSMDIILEACNKTMNQIHNPSFNYADTILKGWKDKGIKKLSDIKPIDEEHAKAKAVAKANALTSASQKSEPAKTKNSFNSFEQRTYNYADLEKKLLNS